MNEHSTLPHRNEYTLTVENMTLRLMVDPTCAELGELPGPQLPEMHTHAYTEIFACLQGGITLVTEEAPIRLLPGDIALVPAELRHVCTPTTADGVWKSIGVIPIRRRTRGCQNLYRPIAALCHEKAVLVKRHCSELSEGILRIEEGARIADGTPAALRALRILLFFTEATDAKSDTADSPLYGGEIRRIARLEDIVECSYEKNLTNEAVAAMLYISPRQLSRIVKRRYGTTLHAVITKRRIEAARSMLTHTRRPVEEIGTAVGFRSKSCFYAAFEQACGLSPKEYRKLHGR